MTALKWNRIGKHQYTRADALDALKGLETGSIDAVITDPPYCSGGSSESERVAARSQGVRSDRPWFVGDAMTTAGLVWLLRNAAIEAARVLKPDGNLLVFTDWRMVPMLAPALETSGLRWRNQVVWDKGHAGLGRGFRPRHEMVLHFTKGATPAFDTRAANLIAVSRVPGRSRVHPTEKPTELLQQLVRATAPAGGVVCDPFAGSGSLAAAAHMQGCRAILAERDPAFCRVIADRLASLASRRSEFSVQSAGARRFDQKK